MDYSVTVLTPTYNRKDKLQNLFISLCNQDSFNFIWLVIDDGSTDDTESWIASIKESAPFCIKYFKKPNGGKHTALNIGFRMSESYLTFIVDSDDILTSNAISLIISTIPEIKKNNLCGVSFLRGYDESSCIGKEFLHKHFISNYIKVRIKDNISGDKAEAWRTDILSKYSFPTFENEKFLSESYLWKRIALDYDMLYINRIIYITRYLDGGLTNSGKPLRISNPCGGMACNIIGTIRIFPLKYRIKSGILFNMYYFFAGEKKYSILNDGDSFICFLTKIPGYLLYKLWDKKYKKQ